MIDLDRNISQNTKALEEASRSIKALLRILITLNDNVVELAKRLPPEGGTAHKKVSAEVAARYQYLPTQAEQDVINKIRQQNEDIVKGIQDAQA